MGATLTGTVHDTTGAALRGATVTVRQIETGASRTLITGADGRYAAPSVPVGNYTVKVTHEGFAPQEQSGIVLVVGQSQVVDFTLGVGDVHQDVVVDAEVKKYVNITSQQTSGLIDEREVKELPLNGRSYDQLLTLNPAIVNYTNQRSGGIGTSNASVGNMFSVSGRRPQDNFFLLNGIEYTGASLMNVTPGGTSGELLGVDAVREFNVVTDTYGANYGKRDGAQVSIVTTSGTNNIRGSAFEFLRNSALDARNYFDQASIPEFQRNQFGASLGGPSAKTSFSSSAITRASARTGASAQSPLFRRPGRQGYLPDSSGTEVYVGVNSAVTPLLNLWPAATAPSFSPTAFRAALPKRSASAPAHPRGLRHLEIRRQPQRKDLLFAVYTVDDSAANTPSANPFSYVNESLRSQVASIQEQHVFSPSLLNTARFGFSRASYFFTGYTPVDETGWVPASPSEPSW